MLFDLVTRQGVGIYLENTKAPSFNRMRLENFDNFGIVARNVAGFLLANSVVRSAGTAAGEGNIIFGLPNPGGVNGLVPGTTATIRNTEVESSFEHNVAFYAQSGVGHALLIEQTAPSLPVGDPVCRVGFNNAITGGYGVLVQLEGAATTGTVNVQQCFLRDNRVANLMARSSDTANLTVTVNGSNVNRSGAGIVTPGGDGIVLANFDSAGITAAITNNTISNNARSGIRMGESTALAASLLRATITGNSFVSPLTATDATIAGRFISNSQARLLIANNGAATEGQPQRFEQLGSLPGILIDTSVGTPNVSVTLTNNHVDLNDSVNPLNTPGTRGSFGIDLQARAGTVCAAVGGVTGGNASHWFPLPVASNSTGTVLTAPVPADTGTTVTLTLAAGSDMPSIFPFYAIVGDSEVVEVTGRTGNTLTMVRAQENTTRADHPGGRSVQGHRWPASRAAVTDRCVPAGSRFADGGHAGRDGAAGEQRLARRWGQPDGGARRRLPWSRTARARCRQRRSGRPTDYSRCGSSQVEGPSRPSTFSPFPQPHLTRCFA